MDGRETQYKCTKCKDIGWIRNEHDAYRRCDCYEKEKIERLWKAFGANPKEVKKLNNYIPYDELTKKVKQSAAQYIKSFEDIRKNRENSFGLFGQSGAGKTHVIVSIGAALLNNNVKAIYMPYLEAMRELKANVIDNEHYIKLIGRYQQAEVLIIDDLFKEKVRKGNLIGYITEADMKHIYPIINYRYFNYLPTLISSECTPSMLCDLDDALAGRMLEFCGEDIFIFDDLNYNYRMRRFK